MQKMTWAALAVLTASLMLGVSTVGAAGAKVADRAANRQAKAANRPADRQAKRQGEVDRRQARQEQRIEHGIAKGYLTPEVSQALEAQQKSIADLESSFKSDGKLSKDEFKQLNQALNVASVQIWAQKHDTEGQQMPTYRFGKNVFAKDDLTARLESSSLTPADAKALLKEFHQMMGLKHRLATADLTPEQRTKLQSEFNDLLNKYFVIK